MTPIRLSDAELDAIFAACRPIAVERRDDFLRHVAHLLQCCLDPGPGDVDRAIRAAERAHCDYPDLSKMTDEQIALIHGLRALHSEVETARADIPKLPAIVSQLHAETTNTDKKIAALERELSAAKTRLGKMRVEQSVMSHNLAELQRAQATAKTEIIEVETNRTRFTMTGLSPEVRTRSRFRPGMSQRGGNLAKPASRNGVVLNRTRDNPEPRRRRGVPPGYEHLGGVKWDKLTPAQIDFVCVFAYALREIRQHETDLLRLSAVDRIRSLCDAMRELRQCR